MYMYNGVGKGIEGGSIGDSYYAFPHPGGRKPTWRFEALARARVWRFGIWEMKGRSF